MNNRVGEGHMNPLEEGAVHQAMPQGIIEHGAQASEEIQLVTDRPQTNGRRKVHMRMGDVIPGKSHASQGRNNPNDSERR